MPVFGPPYPFRGDFLLYRGRERFANGRDTPSITPVSWFNDITTGSFFFL